MNCYAWNIPVGCYAAALDANGGRCPVPLWFWLALAGAAGLAVAGGRKRGVLGGANGSVTSSREDWKTWGMAGAGVLALLLFTSDTEQSADSSSAQHNKSRHPCPVPDESTGEKVAHG